MNTSESENLMFQIINIENHSLSIFRMHGLHLVFLITFYVICSLMVITGEAMIVFYIKKYSPKDQSINRMIFVDQVCTLDNPEEKMNCKFWFWFLELITLCIGRKVGTPRRSHFAHVQGSQCQRIPLINKIVNII